MRIKLKMDSSTTRITVPYGPKAWTAKCKWLSTCTVQEFQTFVEEIEKLNDGGSLTRLVLVKNEEFCKALVSNTAFYNTL